MNAHGVIRVAINTHAESGRYTAAVTCVVTGGREPSASWGAGHGETIAEAIADALLENGALTKFAAALAGSDPSTPTT